MSRIISRFEVDYTAKKDAFPYQMQAVETIKDMEYSAIFHEQGLGKTKIAIDLLLYWLTKKEIDTVIIVTKKQLVKNWEDEFKIHTHIIPKVLSSDRNNNFYVLNSPAKVIVTNFETISTDIERIKLFLKCRNVGIIIDESTKLKNPEAKLTKDFFEIAPLFKIRTIMTGTPIANRPYDIWAQIYFLDFGKSLGKDFYEFKNNTDLRNDFKRNVKKREEFEDSVSEIFSKIESFSVRETKNTCGIQLPKKEYVTKFVDFGPIQKEMYISVLRDLEVEIKRNNETVIDDDSVVLKRLLRLIQIASNPKLVSEDYLEESAKEKLLEDLLKQIFEKNEKCIVWTNYIDNVEYFFEKYSKYGSCKIHGELDIKSRNKAVEMFKTVEDCRVLFATPQAAKEGLTLTVANHVIFYDRGFNLDDYTQAQDRIHRISQVKKCYVYNLMIKDSIDEWIDKLLEAKQYAAFLAQGDITEFEYKQKADYGYGDLVKDILKAGNKENSNV